MGHLYVDDALAIMGGNYFGPRDSLDTFERGHEAPRVTEERPLPWGSDTLREHATTHLLFWDCGVPIQDMPVCARFFRGGYNNRCFKRKEAFLREWARPGWHLLRMDVVPGSTNLSAAQQLELLGPTVWVPTLPVLIRAAVALVLQSKGERRLYETSMVRCDTFYRKNDMKIRLEFGSFDQSGFQVWYPDDEREREFVGIATEVSPESVLTPFL